MSGRDEEHFIVIVQHTSSGMWLMALEKYMVSTEGRSREGLVVVHGNPQVGRHVTSPAASHVTDWGEDRCRALRGYCGTTLVTSRLVGGDAGSWNMKA
jgi:hypothetical protein